MSAAETRRVLSLSEVADVLHMKRPNVARFLARREVEPAFVKAQGYFWWEADILAVKATREADTERMAADRQRRISALARLAPAEPVAEIRLGATQRALVERMLRRPEHPTDATRFALLRLAKRGLVERVEGERFYRLTAAGRSVAGNLS